ncbi:hypothetical protein B0H11DRAFT_2314942 [Mycena galericulata]|nr:hypothetical protein B0H11DRAFT_2314942 [Mycena galericulata]
MIKSYLSVRRASGSVSAGKEKGPTPRDRPPPRRPLARKQEVRADAYGRATQCADPMRTVRVPSRSTTQVYLAHRLPPSPSSPLSRAAPTSHTACCHRPRRLLAVPVRHCRRYAAHHPAPYSRTTPLESRTTTSLPFMRRPSHRHSPPPCPTSLGSVAKRWREEQDVSAPVSHVRD